MRAEEPAPPGPQGQCSALSGAGGGSLVFDLVYDDSSRDPDKLAANRAAILRALIEGLQAHKLELVRASDQPTAPLPF